MFFIIYAVVVLFIQLPLTLINYLCVKNREGYFRQSAVNIDRYGNREFRATWNKLLITNENDHKFGNIYETISEVLGYAILNERMQKEVYGYLRDPQLTKAGRALVKSLSEKHCTEATIKTTPENVRKQRVINDRTFVIGISLGYTLGCWMVSLRGLAVAITLMSCLISLIITLGVLFKSKGTVFSGVGCVLGMAIYFMYPYNIWWMLLTSSLLIFHSIKAIRK